LWTLFVTPSQKRKKIYFSYEIEASINAFKAKHNMHHDKILTKKDYEAVQIPLNKLPSRLISCKIDKKLITKNYVKEEELLTYNKIEVKKDVLKGNQIRAYMVDGSLVIGIDATLLQDANIGDRVKVRTKENKILRAKLFSSSEAMILQ
jgi:flagella basal body P-ring formation protein FlgA